MSSIGWETLKSGERPKYSPEKAAELLQQYESLIAGGVYKGLVQTKH